MEVTNVVEEVVEAGAVVEGGESKCRVIQKYNKYSQ